MFYDFFQVDATRVRLLTEEEVDDISDYINAVFVDVSYI